MSKKASLLILSILSMPMAANAVNPYYICQPCGKGQYEKDGKCTACPKGQCQDEIAQTSCKKCGDNVATCNPKNCTALTCEKGLSVVDGKCMGCPAHSSLYYRQIDYTSPYKDTYTLVGGYKCYCDAGYYRNSSGDCEICPAGYECKGTQNEEALSCGRVSGVPTWAVQGSVKCTPCQEISFDGISIMKFDQKYSMASTPMDRAYHDFYIYTVTGNIDDSSTMRKFTRKDHFRRDSVYIEWIGPIPTWKTTTKKLWAYCEKTSGKREVVVECDADCSAGKRRYYEHDFNAEPKIEIIKRNY